MASCSTNKQIAKSMKSYGQETTEYQLPPYDFVVFCENIHSHLVKDKNNVQEYTMFEFDKEGLRQSIKFARYMSSIPPIVVTFYKDGVQIGEELMGFLMKMDLLTGKEFPETPLVKKMETFPSLDDYKNRSVELKKQGNTYILEKESNGNTENKEYVLIWYEYQKENEKQ